MDSAGNVSEAALTGPLSAGVPGSVAGMFEAHRKYGKLPWADVVAPAVALARDGHVLDAIRSRNITAEAERLARFPASRAQFLPGGAAPPSGTAFVQRELGAALQLLADSGPKPFYSGSIANLIVQEMQRGGGLITKQDLARYRPKWRDPIRITYRGYTIYTMPPSGGGVTLAEILNVMEGYPSLPRFGSAALMHLEAETMRRAFVDRNRYLGDPDVVTLPVERLLSKEYAASLRAEIDATHATPTPRMQPAVEGTETTHYSVVDADGNAVACTTTLNNDFGSAVTVTGAGFLLNDEMDDFTTAPGKANLFGLVQGANNAIAPGKRMLSAMTPTVVLDSAGALLHGAGLAGRLADYDGSVPGDQQRHRSRHVVARCRGRAAPASSGAARSPVRGARGVRARIARLADRDGPHHPRVALQDGRQCDREDRRRVGRRGRSPARRRRSRVLRASEHGGRARGTVRPRAESLRSGM